MKPTACLINVARGEVVDEDALYGALKDRTIAGAAVDVWYRYPTTDEPNIRPGRNPFHALDNIIMTPHLSGNTDQLWERRFTAIADNLKRFRDGRNLRNAVEWLVFE
jgi:phosphoglycerate dehydrogenase-like enzyme